MASASDILDGELITELEAEMHPFRSQIADAEVVRCALALASQARIAQANARLERVHVEGLGEVVASIDAEVFHRFGQLYGYETVTSPDFLKSLLRDNPEMRVKSRAQNTTVRLKEHYRECRVSGVE